MYITYYILHVYYILHITCILHTTYYMYMTYYILHYRLDMLGGDGLDYEHAVLAVSRLAKFHAVSYAFRSGVANI